MPTGRRGRAAALIALGLVILTGCSGSSHTAKPRPASSTLDTPGPFPIVSGAFGDKPSVMFTPEGLPATQLRRKVLVTGHGAPLAKGDLAVVDYLGQIWNGKVFDNSYDAGQAAAVQVGIGGLLPGWDAGLVGVPVGSRVELTLPPTSGYGAEGNSKAGITGKDTLVFVVDVAARYDTKATADPSDTTEALPAHLPIVTGAPPRPPEIAIPKGLPIPHQRSTHVIARGHGAPVRTGSLVIQYDSINWMGQFVSSTWQNGVPTAVPIGDATDTTGGLFDGLVGVPLGSRVLIVAPGVNNASGDSATNSAAVVVDVIAQVSTAKKMISG